MNRISYTVLETIVNDWNEGHPELLLKLFTGNGLYHIGIADGTAIERVIVCEDTCRGAYEKFRTWEDGFWTHERMIEEGKYQILSAKGKIVPMKN